MLSSVLSLMAQALIDFTGNNRFGRPLLHPRSESDR